MDNKFYLKRNNYNNTYRIINNKNEIIYNDIMYKRYALELLYCLNNGINTKDLFKTKHIDYFKI